VAKNSNQKGKLDATASKNLQKEVKRAIDRAIKGFSLMRAAGKKDESDQGIDNSDESDDDNSIEFLGSVETEKVLGPHIPAEHRLIVAQALQKMGSLWNEKKQKKGSIIQDWRLKASNKKIGEMKNYSQALFSLHKIFQKRKNYFFKINESASAKGKSDLDKLPNFDSARPSNTSLKVPKTTIAESFVIDSKQNSDPSSSSRPEIAKLQKEIDSLRALVKQKDELIRSLEEEKHDWLNSQDQSISRILESPVDKNLHSTNSNTFNKLTSQNFDLKRRVTDTVIPSPLSQHNERNPLQSELDETKKKVRTLEDELRRSKDEINRISALNGKNGDLSSTSSKMQPASALKAKTSDSSKDGSSGISIMRKTRILGNLLSRVERTLKLKSLISLIKTSVKKTQSMGEAGLRIKGRLLQFLSEKHGSSAGVRRSFLRWAVFINKNFLRDCITKVALNSRITHQSALWRFLKMVPRNVKVKLSEGAKRIRYLKAMSIIELMININNVICVIHAMNQIRPGVIGYKNRKLIDLLVKRSQLDEASKLKTMFGMIKKNKQDKGLFKDLFSAYNDKLADALAQLRKNNAFSKLEETLYMTDPDFITSADLLSKAARRNISNAISLKRLDSINNLLRALIDKIESGHKRQLDGVFNALGDNLADWRQAEAEKAWKTKLHQATLRNLLEKLADACKGKCGQALNRLAGKVIAEKFEAEKARLEEIATKMRKDKVLKGVLVKAEELWKRRERAAYDKLLGLIAQLLAAEKLDDLLKDYDTFKVTAADKLKKAANANLLRKLINGLNGSTKDALDRLRNFFRDAENAQRLKDYGEQKDALLKKKLLSNLLAKLANGAGKRCGNALSKLLANKNLLAFSEELEKARSQAERERRGKIQKQMLERLKLAQDGKCKQALFNTQQNNSSIDHRKTISGLNSTTADTIKRLILTTAFDRLVKSQKAKQRLALKRMGDLNREKGKQEQEKGNALKKLASKLGNSGRVKIGNALGKLRLVNAILEGDEKFSKANKDKDQMKKDSKVKSFLEDLIAAQLAKKKQAFDSLGYHCGLRIDADTLTRTKEEAAKRLSKEILSKLLDKIKRAYDSKGKELLAALLENSRKVEFQDQLKNAKNEVAHAILKNLGRLLKEKMGKDKDDHLREAFDKIKSMSLAQQFLRAQQGMEEERLRLQKKAKNVELLERLKAACLAKEREVLTLLKVLNEKAKSSSEWDKALEEYKQKLRNKSLSYALARISGAQGGRLKDAFSFFVENAKEASRREKFFNDRLFKAQKGKLKEALDLLRDLSDLLKTQEAIESAKNEAKNMLEEAETRMKKKRVVDFLNRLKLAQEAKLSDTLRHLRGNKIGIQHDEETRHVLEEAGAKIKARRIQAFLTKLKLAQNAKETEAFGKLVEASKAIEAAKTIQGAKEEADRALKTKNLKSLYNLLNGSALGKLAAGLRLLRNHSQNARHKELEGLGKTRNMLGKLYKAQGLKNKDALSRLNGQNLLMKSQDAEEMLRKVRDEELKKSALKALLDRLANSLNGKLGLADGLLKANNNLQKSEEIGQKLKDQLSKKKIFNLLNGLIKAQLAKERACLQRGAKNAEELGRIENENEFKKNLLEEKARAARLAAFKQLFGNNAAKTLAALGLLKENLALQNMLLSENERRAYLNGLKKNNLLKGLINAQLAKEAAGLNSLKKNSDVIASKNSDAKKAKAIATLLKNYNQKLQNALRKMVMNGLAAAAEKERERAKLLNMLKNLMGGLEDKEKACLGRLKDWATSESHAEFMAKANLRNNLTNLMTLAGKNGDKSLEQCYIKMKEYAKNALRKEALKKLLIAHLLRGQQGKLLDSQNRIRKFNIEELNKIWVNTTQMEIENDRIMYTKRALLDHLIKAQLAKEKKSWEQMQQNSSTAEKRNKDKDKMANLMAGHLRRNWGDARLDAYRILVKFNQLKQLQEKKDRVLLEDLLRRLGAANGGKLLGAFSKLKDKNAKDKLQDLERKKLLNDLLKGLEGAYGQKQKDAFGKLKDHYLIMDSKMTKEGYAKSQLAKNLADNLKDKLADALKKLRDLNKGEKDRLKREQELLKLLGKKIGGANNSKLIDSLYLLRNHSKDAELEETKKKLKRGKLLERLIPAQIKKEESAFDILKNHFLNAAQAEKVKKSATGILLSRLIAAQNAKQLEAIRNLDKFKDEILRRSTQAKDKLNFLIKKVNAGYTGKLYDALNMMRKKNSTDKRLLEEFESKMIFLLNRLAAAHYLKTLEAYHKLHKLISGGKSKEQIKADAGALLARKLIAAQLAKEGTALGGLNKANAEGQFLEMLHRVGKGNALSKLFGCSNGKLKGGLDLMRAFNQLMKLKDNEAKDALGKLLRRLELANLMKQAEALKKLQDNKRDSQNNEDKAFKALKYLLNRLNGSTAAKEASAFKDMLAFSRLNKEEDPEVLRVLACKRLLNHLVKACHGKENEALQKLASTANHRRNLLERLLQGLTGKGDKLAGQAMNRLRHHSANCGLQEAVKGQILERLAGMRRLTAAQELRDLYNKLKNWRNDKLAEEKNAARVANKIGGRWGNAKKEAYLLLKQKAQNMQMQEERQERLKSSLARNLVKAQEEKVGSTFGKMGDWKKKGDAAKQREDFLLRQLLNMLEGSQTSAQKSCLGHLRIHNTKAQMKEMDEASKKKELLRRLINAQNDKKGQAYHNMQSNAQSALEALRKRLDLLKTLLGKLEEASQRKEAQALKKLKDQSNLFDKLLNRLRVAGDKADNMRRQALANACKKLRNWTNEEARREDAKRAKAVQIQERIIQWLKDKMDDERRRALEKLIKNAYEQKLKEERMKKLFNDIASRKELQVQKVFCSMRLNNIIKSVKENEKNNKLGKLLQRMYHRLIEDGYNRLHRRGLFEPKVIDALLSKAELRRNKNLMRHFYDQMIEILKKKPQRVERFGDFLTSKIRLRQQQGFSEIKLFLELARRERINKGMVKLIEFFSRTGLCRCRGSFEEVKKQFHNDNPWFRRAVDKMTISVTCSEQIAFWKLRKQERFGASAIVNAEKTIKLKKFLQIIDQKRGKLMTSALERILARNTYGLGESMLNTSYLSQSNRPSVIRR
jgi:hypothetical protein